MVAELILRVVSAVAGIALVVWTIMSITRMLLLPRSDNVPLTRFVFRNLLRLMHLFYLRRMPTFNQRDRILAYWVPFAMLTLPMLWLFLLMIGFALVIFALDSPLDPVSAFELSGSSLMTLGFRDSDIVIIEVLTFTEAAMGMMFIALLIGYIPQMYSAYSAREREVTRLEYYAGVPFSAVEMIRRLNFIGTLYDNERTIEFMKEWEIWFAQLDESHTTLAPMNFFRSPKPGRSWLVAAGTVLDGGSLIAAVVDVDAPRSGGVMIRSGFMALRSIADFFRLEYDHDPSPDDPISVTRDEFDEACVKLEAAGIRLKPDRDQAWRDFQGWRVNYDYVLRTLASITHAPYAPWISDHIVNADGTFRDQDAVQVKEPVKA